MADTVILRGFTATAPQLRTLPTGIPVVNFRLASTPRWFDSATNSWREGQTSWYTVCAYRKLAQNIAASLTVGSPVLLTGRVRTQQWQREDGSQGASVEVDASSIGLDLTFGTSTFSRTVEHSGTQSRTQNDNKPDSKGCIAGRPCRSPTTIEYTAIPKPYPSRSWTTRNSIFSSTGIFTTQKHCFSIYRYAPDCSTIFRTYK